MKYWACQAIGIKTLIRFQAIGSSESREGYLVRVKDDAAGLGFERRFIGSDTSTFIPDAHTSTAVPENFSDYTVISPVSRSSSARPASLNATEDKYIQFFQDHRKAIVSQCHRQQLHGHHHRHRLRRIKGGPSTSAMTACLSGTMK